MAAWTDDDAAFADLREWLTRQGFVVLLDSYSPDSFGNQAVTLARPIAVRLVRDRGQWSVDICGEDGAWRPLHEWSHELTGQRTRDFSATAEADRLRRLLRAIEKASGSANAATSRDIQQR
jgi:hypothetical protein